MTVGTNETKNSGASCASRAFRPGSTFPTLAAVVLLGLVFTGSIGLAQGVPLSPGQASVTLSAPALVQSGDTFNVGLQVDLTGWTGTCGGATVPLVLGGYALSVGFDPDEVVFVSAAGGASAPYASTPANTNPAFANANGAVLLNAIQSDPAAPSGLVQVAVLTFRAVAGASSAILTPEPSAVSLSSAIQGCSGGGSAGPVSIPAAGQAITVSFGGAGFHSLTPCRVFDTRLAEHGPALAPAATGVFSVAGACGIDPSAVAVAVNLTVTQTEATGELRAFPGNQAVPIASSLSFRAGATRANNGIFLLSTDGAGTIAIHNASAGTVHVILDVNGFFR